MNKINRFYRILFICLIGLLISIPNIIRIESRIFDKNNTQSSINIESSGSWNLTGSPILIDDLDLLLNWNETADNYEWYRWTVKF